MDGTGKTRFTGNVLLGGNKILEVSAHPPNTDPEGIANGVVDYDTIGCEVIDCTDKVIAQGGGRDVFRVQYGIDALGFSSGKHIVFRTLHDPVPVAKRYGRILADTFGYDHYYGNHLFSSLLQG